MAKEVFEQSDSDPLPYTQVDRAVKTKAALLAGELQVTTQHALGSLVEFWDLNGDPRELEKLLEKGLDEVVISAAEAKIRFRLASGKDVDPRFLATLGLLEQRGEDFRVRGMSRYFKPLKVRLHARTIAAAGGKASAASRKAKNGTAQPARSASGSESGSMSGSTGAEPHLEPASNHAPNHAPNRRRTQPEHSGQRSAVSGQVVFTGADAPGLFDPPQAKPKNRKRASDAPPDPRHRPLVDALVKACPGYQFDGGLDAKAVTTLLTKGDPAEVERRWRQALAHQGFPTVRTLPELARHWNHFNPAVSGKGPVDPSTQGWADVDPEEAF